jgi:phosphoribosylglycinamide formyltransferase-1
LAQTLDNLAVALDDRFDEHAAAIAAEMIARAGCVLEDRDGADDRTLAWIDLAFGGAWSREAFVARNAIARRDGVPVGFASYAPRGLHFVWLRGLGARPGVGIFGPFGVERVERGSVIGPALLTLALCGLRRSGYETALIPAIGNDGLAAYYTRACGAQVVERFDRAAWREPKARAVVMASGAGSTFGALAEVVVHGELPLEIAAVVTNVAGAGVRKRASAVGAEDVLVAWDRPRETREAYDRRLQSTVERYAPDLVLLLGWMHVLDAAFVRAFPELLNLHPSFLPLDPGSDSVGMPDGTVIPAFRGASAVRDAVAAGSGWVGASVHRVTEKTDRGAVVMRAPMQLLDGENETSAYERLRPIERALVPRAVRSWRYER